MTRFARREARSALACIRGVSAFAAASSSAAAEGLALGQALLALGRKSGMQIVFEPGRMAGRRVDGFVSTGDAQADLRRLAGLAGFEVVTLKPGLFALVPARPKRAQVQQAAPGAERDEASPSVDEVVVVAARPGDQVSDIWIKRFATQQIDRTSADEIARLPAASSAEAVRLTPGVQFDNQRGLGEYIYARGLDSNFHLVQLDGRSIALNELIENGGPRGRSFRFEVVPAELVSQLEVVKTPSAADQDGAVGVTVDIQTRKPLDIGERQDLTVQVIDNDLRGVPGGGVSGLVSWVDRDRTLGVAVSGLSRNRFIRNDRFFEFQWARGAFVPTLRETDYAPSRVRPTIELEERTQQAAALAVQWRPTPAYLAELDVLAERLDVHYDEYGLDIYPDDASIRRPVFVPGSERRVGDTIVAGRIDNVRWMASRETSLNRHDLLAAGLRQTFAFSRWKVTADAAYSRAHSFHPDGQGTSRDRIAFFAPLSFDFSGGYRSLASLKTDVDYADPNSYAAWTYNYAPKDSVDIDEAYRIDAERAFDGVLTAVKAGVLRQHRARAYRRRDWFLDGLTGTPLSALGPAYYGALPFGNFMSGLPGDSPRVWVAPSASAFRAALFTPQVAALPLTPDDLAASYDVDEDVLAGYLQASFAFRLFGAPISGEAGLRRASTRQVSSGYVSDGRAATPVSYERSYANWLPSLSLRAELRPDLVLRASVARTLTRPNLIDVAPRITTSLDNETASGGNPDLRAFSATNLDLALEWYPGRSAMLSLSAFRKDMDNYITSQNAPLEVPGHGVLLMTTSVNGGRATLDGLELVFRDSFMLPGVGGRVTLGGSAAAASSQSRFLAGDRPIRDRLTGLSQTSYSLTGVYERGPLSASLGYFWRDRYLNSYGSSAIGEEYVAPLGTLDGQIAVNLSPNLTVEIGVANLTDARKYVFGVSEIQPKEINAFGRTFTFSLKWRRGGG